MTKRQDESSTLSEKLDRVEAKLQPMAEEPSAPTSPEDERQRFAEELRDTMNRSVSRWHEPGV